MVCGGLEGGAQGAAVDTYAVDCNAGDSDIGSNGFSNQGVIVPNVNESCGSSATSHRASNGTCSPASDAAWTLQVLLPRLQQEGYSCLLPERDLKAGERE